MDPVHRCGRGGSVSGCRGLGRPPRGPRPEPATTVRFRPRTGFTRYHEYRLLRLDPRIRFRNVIHETMVPDIHTVARADGLRIGRSDLALDHYGYDGDQRAKHLRDVPLLRERLAREPGHIYRWNHLGRALDGLGDVEGALGAWWRAVGVVRERGVRSVRDALPYGSLLLRPEASAEAPTLLAEALRHFPGDHLFRWVHGQHLLEAGRFAAAIGCFEPLAAIDGEGTFLRRERHRLRRPHLRPLRLRGARAVPFPSGPLAGERALLRPGSKRRAPSTPGIAVKRRLGGGSGRLEPPARRPRRESARVAGASPARPGRSTGSSRPPSRRRPASGRPRSRSSSGPPIPVTPPCGAPRSRRSCTRETTSPMMRSSTGWAICSRPRASPRTPELS